MTQPQPWPWPGDSREDKAKRVASSYRQLVLDIAQARTTDPAGDMNRLDMKWIDLGIYWHLPDRKPLDTDEWMTANDAAILASCTPRNIRDWHYRSHITSHTAADGTPLYNAGEIIQYMASQRQRRSTR